jgi:plastocyanin
MVTHAVAQHTVLKFSWRRLLRWAAYGDIIVMAAMGLVLRDRLPLGLALIAAVSLDLLHFRSGRLGLLILGLLFADTVVWTLSAAIVNVVQGEELSRLFIPASLSAISAAGLIAALALLVWRKDPESGDHAARVVALAAPVFFAIVMLAGFVVGSAQPAIAQSPDIVLRTENMVFSASELSADGGQVTVLVDNHDVWWHTFTIDELDVDLKLPSSAKQQVSFTAAPGTYRFYCAIPGHTALGMAGRLTVR